MASNNFSFKHGITDTLDWESAYKYLKDFDPQKITHVNDGIINTKGIN